MIQLTHRGPVFERDAAWEEASRTFAARHCTLLPQFVEDTLLRRILGLLAEGEFKEREDKTPSGEVFAREVALAPTAPIPALFQLLLNTPSLFAPIQELVDCRADSFPGRKDIGDGRVSAFARGRCFKFMPGPRHFDSWHGDVNAGRQVGLSINLEPDPSAAGGIEVRHRQCAPHRLVPGFGDAMVFRIARGLQHRGLPPVGAVPRCTYSGWFVAGSSVREALGLVPIEPGVAAASETEATEAVQADQGDRG